MILSNTSMLLKKLEDPAPMIDIYFWADIKRILVDELQRKKEYHAKKAMACKVVAEGEGLPSKEESREFNRYQYHIQSANLHHVTIQVVTHLANGLEEIYQYYQVEKHDNNIKHSKVMQNMVSDLDKLYKEVCFYKKLWKAEAGLHSDFLEISIQLAQRVKDLSHDSKN